MIDLVRVDVVVGRSIFKVIWTYVFCCIIKHFFILIVSLEGLLSPDVPGW